jgi:hypothetical protein
MLLGFAEESVVPVGDGDDIVVGNDGADLLDGGDGIDSCLDGQGSEVGCETTVSDPRDVRGGSA